MSSDSTFTYSNGNFTKPKPTTRNLSIPANNTGGHIVTIFKSELVLKQDPMSTATYLQAQFQETATNIVSPDKAGNNINYVAKTMYIYGVLHNNINGLTLENSATPPDPTIVGEVVFECTPATGSGTLYVCYLLKNSGTSQATGGVLNDIDNIVIMHENNSPESYNYTGKSTTGSTSPVNGVIYSTNAQDYVYVVSKPIPVTTETATYVQELDKITSLFGVEPTTTSMGGGGGFSSGDDQIYIDCNPTGEGLDKLDTLSVPIQSEYTAGAAQVDFMKSTQSFYLFTLGAILCYFAIPRIYKFAVIDLIDDLTTSAPENKTNNLATADYSIMLGTIIMIITLLTAGDFVAKSIGIFFGVLLILSVPLIMIEKANTEGYMGSIPKQVKGTMDIDVWTMFLAFLGFFPWFGRKLMNHFVPLATSIFILLVYISILIALFVTEKITREQSNLALSIGLPLLFAACVAISLKMISRAAPA
jgi:hypothetical protein